MVSWQSPLSRWHYKNLGHFSRHIRLKTGLLSAVEAKANCGLATSTTPNMVRPQREPLPSSAMLHDVSGAIYTGGAEGLLILDDILHSGCCRWRPSGRTPPKSLFQEKKGGIKKPFRIPR